MPQCVAEFNNIKVEIYAQPNGMAKLVAGIREPDKTSMEKWRKVMQHLEMLLNISLTGVSYFCGTE